MNVGCAVAFLDALLPFGCSLPCTRSALGPFSCVSFQQMLIDVGLVAFDVPARGDPFRGRVMLARLEMFVVLSTHSTSRPRARDADARSTQRTRPPYAQQRQERRSTLTMSHNARRHTLGGVVFRGFAHARLTCLNASDCK